MLLQVNFLGGNEIMLAFHTQLARRFNFTRSYHVFSSIRNLPPFPINILPLAFSFLYSLWTSTSGYQSLRKRPPPSLLDCVPKILSSPGLFTYTTSCWTPIALYQNAWRKPNPHICYYHGPATIIHTSYSHPVWKVSCKYNYMYTAVRYQPCYLRYWNSL